MGPCGSAVPINRHEAEGWIDRLVDDREVQSYRSAIGPSNGSGPPSGSTPRLILAPGMTSIIDHITEIARIWIEVVVTVRRGGAKSFLERNPFYT